MGIMEWRLMAPPQVGTLGCRTTGTPNSAMRA